MPGIAIINGIYFESDEPISFQMDAADTTLKRIDRIVIRVDVQARDVYPVVIVGVFATNPVAPPFLRNESFFDLVLADVQVNQLATAITQAVIFDRRMDPAMCGFIGSIIAPDTRGWNSQFTAIINGMIGDRSSQQSQFITQLTKQQSDFLTQFNAQMNTWLTFYDSMQSLITLSLIPFYFWNLAALPGCQTVTSYPSNGSIRTAITNTATNKPVALGVTTYPPGGSIVYEEIVYQPDGITIQRHTRETTTYQNGEIRKAVTSIV
jgi:hypothetical protein